MEKRSATPLRDVELEPYQRYGKPQPKLSWRPLVYDKEKGSGSFLMRIEPGGHTPAHEHTYLEQILVLEGDFIDSDDGTRFGPGDFITYEPGSRHSSTTENGCLILAFVRGYSQLV